MYLKGGCENGQGLSGGWCLRPERGGPPQKGPDSAQPRVPGFQAGGLS